MFVLFQSKNIFLQLLLLNLKYSLRALFNKIFVTRWIWLAGWLADDIIAGGECGNNTTISQAKTDTWEHYHSLVLPGDIIPCWLCVVLCNNRGRPGCCIPAINYIDPGVDIELSEWHKHKSWLVMQYVMTEYILRQLPFQLEQTHQFHHVFPFWYWKVKTCHSIRP